MAIGAMGRNAVEILLSADDQASRKLDAVSRKILDSGRHWQATGKRMMTMGAAGVASMALMARESARFAQETLNMASVAGVTTDEIQALTYAFEQEGAQAQMVIRGLQSLRNYTGEAAAGSETYRRHFQALGIAWADESGNARSATDILQDLSAVMAGGATEQQKYAAAALIGRRSFLQMSRALEQGPEHFRRMREEVAHTVVSEEDLLRIKKQVGDQMTLMGRQARFLGLSLVKEMDLTPLTRGLERLIGWYRDLSPEQQAFISKMAMLIPIGLLAGGALMYLAGTVKALTVLGSPLMLKFLGFVIVIDLLTRVMGGFLQLLGKGFELSGRLFRNEGMQAFGAGLVTEGKDMVSGGVLGQIGKGLGIDLNAGEMLKGMFKTATADTGAKKEMHIDSTFEKSDEALARLGEAIEEFL